MLDEAIDRLVFRLHAIQRMFERQISVEDVRQVLSSGETTRTIRPIRAS